jgi:hypothetical protein
MLVDLHATIQTPLTVMLWMMAAMWVARARAFPVERMSRMSQYLLGVYFVCLAVKQQWWSIRWHLLAMGSEGIADSIQEYGLLIPIAANLIGLFAGAVVLGIASRPFFGKRSGHVVGGAVCCLLIVGALSTWLGR